MDLGAAVCVRWLHKLDMAWAQSRDAPVSQRYVSAHIPLIVMGCRSEEFEAFSGADAIRAQQTNYINALFFCHSSPAADEIETVAASPSRPKRLPHTIL